MFVQVDSITAIDGDAPGWFLVSGLWIDGSYWWQNYCIEYWGA